MVENGFRQQKQQSGELTTGVSNQYLRRPGLKMAQQEGESQSTRKIWENVEIAVLRSHGRGDNTEFYCEQGASQGGDVHRAPVSVSSMAFPDACRTSLRTRQLEVHRCAVC